MSLRYRVPVIGGGEVAKSRSILTKVQGYIRASGSLVEINLPGVYTGEPLSWDRALKIAKKGLQDCENSRRQKSLVRLYIRGHCDRAGPPEQLELMFKKMLAAARKARMNAAQERRIIQNPRGK